MKWLIVIFLLLSLLFIASACGDNDHQTSISSIPTETPPPATPTFCDKWVTYHNDTYDYSIQFPAGWWVHHDDPQIIGIFQDRSHPCAPCPQQEVAVTISVSDYRLPLAASIDIHVDTASNSWEDFKVVWNGKPSPKWDWLVAAEYYFNDIHFYEECYFLEDGQIQITCSSEADSDCFNIAQEIADSFSLHP